VSSPAVTLPYQFDTSPVVRLILQLMLGLLLIIVAGLFYTIVVSDRAGSLALLASGAIAAYFTRLFHRHLESSQGTVTADQVVVEPGMLYGVPLSGPKGRFPVRYFKCVRVERMPALAFAQGGPHERVRLIGLGGTPNILIGRTDDDAGCTLGRELAQLLKLPYEEERAPY
jgi:hypothetical protein